MSSSGKVVASWTRVVSGAQLVASAVAQQSSSGVSAVAQRVTYHGLDLTTKARQTIASSDIQSIAATAIQNTILQAAAVASPLAGPVVVNGMSNTRTHFRPNNDDRYTAPSAGSGTTPYESQLRKKLQDQQHQQSQSIISRDGEQYRNSTIPTPARRSPSTTVESFESIPNPYLFHLPPPSSSSASSSSFVASSLPLVDNNRSTDSIPDDSIASKLSTTSPSSSPTTVDRSSIHDNSNSTLSRNDVGNDQQQQQLQQDGEAQDVQQPQQQQQYLREGRPVPSTRLGRAFGFATLGAGLAWGTVGGYVSSVLSASSSASSSSLNGTDGDDDNNNNNRTGRPTSAVVTDANADRLAATLCRMRGAALKMGQMLSIQDESLLPSALTRALKQVRQGADAMPKYQLLNQLESQLGENWRDRFVTFEEQPFAAASIGQVHRATIDDGNGTVRRVVVKVQYPGVAQSIESDLGNLAMLVRFTGLSPKGLFIDNVMRVGMDELKVECNYLNEMANQETFQTLVGSNLTLQQNKFVVPDVFSDWTTDQIITTAYAPGGTIDKVMHLDQKERNRIGRTIMYLTMQELFVWRLMQTDPNWGNFLYDVATETTSLIDFGATREYPKSFVDGYLRIVWASANQDEDALMFQSHRMNFLTGEENDTMLNAHKLSGFTVGEPFWKDEPFDFRGSQISSRMSEHTSVFLRHRLTPPPEEVYTLHRKLAGAYMLCIKLGAVIQCRDMLEDIVSNHVFEDGLPPPTLYRED